MLQDTAARSIGTWRGSISAGISKVALLMADRELGARQAGA
jgi:hypothetical protein